MYLNFFQRQISNVFKAFQRESLDVFEMFNVRVKMSLDLVQCKKLRCIQMASSGLKIYFIPRVNLFLNVFQPQSSDPFKFLFVPQILLSLNIFLSQT